VQDAAGAIDIPRLERWFVARGVPHFIDHYAARTDIWTRAAPLLVLAYLVGGFRALDIRHWSLGKNLLASAIIVAVLLAGWVVANIVLRRPWLTRPRVIGKPELVAFVIGPSIPSLVFTQYRDAIVAFGTGILVLIAIYFGTSYAVLPMLRWAFERLIAQVRSTVALIARVLPLLLLFTTFLFVNADVWGVAGPLDGPAYWMTLAIFVLLGVLFVTSRVPPLMADLATFPTWSEVVELLADTPAEACPIPADGSPDPCPLNLRQKLNVGLLMLFSQALQITIVVALLVGFFTVFGFLAMSEATTRAWTGVTDLHVYLRWHLGDRDLVLTEPLLRIAGFLGAFSGMYFTVALSTDATYRDEFADDVRPEVHRLLAARIAYIWSLREGARTPTAVATR
jgi:hypothetical protein